LRYKCNSCGQPRSLRYHRNHPLWPGQPPARTTCRRCREEAAESETESIDSCDVEDSGHRLSRSRRYLLSTANQSHRRRNHSRRSQQPRRHSEKDLDSTDYDNGYLSVSSSTAKGRSRRSRSKLRYQIKTLWPRSRSQDFETVRYIDTSQLRPVPTSTRTVYFDSTRNQDLRDKFQDDEDHHREGYSRRSVSE
jgi:uncharacterized membrane protein